MFGYFTAVPEASSGRLVTIDPVRVLDTRSGEGQRRRAGPGCRAGDGPGIHGRSDPDRCHAVVMTLTGDQATAPGYIQAVPTGDATALRSSSNINLDRAGDTMANTVIIPLGADGTVTLFTQSGANLVVDVVGYFTGASEPSTTTGLFIPIKPTARGRHPGGRNRARGARAEWSDVGGAVPGQSAAGGRPAEQRSRATSPRPTRPRPDTSS